MFPVKSIFRQLCVLLVTDSIHNSEWLTNRHFENQVKYIIVEEDKFKEIKCSIALSGRSSGMEKEQKQGTTPCFFSMEDTAVQSITRGNPAQYNL